MKIKCLLNSETLKLTLVTVKSNFILIGETNRSRFTIKVPSHVTVSDKICKLVLHHTLK